MVLTEPDAGSDLQAVRLRAYQDEQGNWYLNGVKRFITNGCGEILLVLARSEPDISDGRGLSLFISERSRAGQGPPPGEEAGHPRLAHLRAGVRQHALPADRRAAARPDHLRDGADERRPRRHRRPVAGRRRGGLPPGPHLRPHAAAVRRADRAAAGRGRAGHRHEDRHRGGPGADLRDQPRLRPREQQPPRAGTRRRRLDTEEEKRRKQLSPHAQAAQRHAHADEQVLLLRDVHAAWPTTRSRCSAARAT